MPTPGPVTPSRRCAVYTRKSTDEGLDQEYNSLEAQRDAGLAFIASQRHEGWIAVEEGYDDGGYSGGHLDRPALKRLLADIEAGRIDIVVVYKIDRLTRSLADFAKLVEVFDRNGVSFVSVTQQFNTTTSMGRLTLNILLSFAQFEREVTGERIRDKIAASKAKGMWMGGMPPLGYDVVDRKLVVNEREAALVRDIFRRYAEHGSTVHGRRAMAEWTVERVAERFREAAITAHRLPPVRVQGYFNTWPAIRRMPWETLGAEPSIRRFPPSPEAIERMLETMRWVLWLEEEARPGQPRPAGTGVAARHRAAAQCPGGDPDPAAGRAAHRSPGAQADRRLAAAICGRDAAPAARDAAGGSGHRTRCRRSGASLAQRTGAHAARRR
ncbi:DUF6362 family protein [Ralstonia mannitolilytica]